MVQRFRKTRPWDVEAEPPPARKPRISAGEWGGLGWACAIGGIGFVAGASVISAAGMGWFAGVTMALFVTAIVASVRARRQP